MDPKVKAYMDAPFVPNYGNNLAPDLRTANAAEYTAHHMGRISALLERLVDALEKLPPKP